MQRGKACFFRRKVGADFYEVLLRCDQGIATLMLQGNDTYEYIGSFRPPYVQSWRQRMWDERTTLELLQTQVRLRELQDRIDQYQASGRFMELPPEVLRQRALEELPELDLSRFNIALVGPSGMGKSSLVNALLAVYGPQNDEDRAQVSSSEECTQEIRRYDVRGRAMSLWDLPGGGTPKHPTSSFVDDKHLAAFDMQVIVMEGRFTDFHKTVFEAALAKFTNQRIAAVCAKGDALVYQEQMTKNLSNSDALARKTFRFSIWHLSLLFAALLLDHYLGPWIQGMMR
jgi:GTP-binding protein EngB required for normal cell division